MEDGVRRPAEALAPVLGGLALDALVSLGISWLTAFQVMISISLLLFIAASLLVPTAESAVYTTTDDLPWGLSDTNAIAKGKALPVRSKVAKPASK